MPEAFLVEAVHSIELRAAFCLLFQHLPLQERQQAVENALALVEGGELLREQVLVVHVGDQLCGVVVYSMQNGSAGQVWPPQVAAGNPQLELEDALLREAIYRLQLAGAKFVQALLGDNELGSAPCLARHRFAQLSSLLTLAYSLQASEGWPEILTPALPLIYQAFPLAEKQLFQEILERTYEDSLDFPELNQLRDAEEILEIHRRHGVYHPEQWLLAWHQGEPVGVLLLVEMPDQAEWELSYVGVVRPARGKGIGKELVREALRRAGQLQTRQLTVTVDSRNLPAWNLYASLEFLPLAEQHVFLLLSDR